MRIAVLMMSGALVFAAPAFAQPSVPTAEAEAAAAAPETPAPEAAPATPEPEADPMICRETQNVGSRMRSQRTRQCQPRSRWEREDADMRRQYDRAANQGQAIAPPSGSILNN